MWTLWGSRGMTHRNWPSACTCTLQERHQQETSDLKEHFHLELLKQEQKRLKEIPRLEEKFREELLEQEKATMANGVLIFRSVGVHQVQLTSGVQVESWNDNYYFSGTTTEGGKEGFWKQLTSAFRRLSSRRWSTAETCLHQIKGKQASHKT